MRLNTDDDADGGRIFTHCEPVRPVPALLGNDPLRVNFWLILGLVASGAGLFGGLIGGLIGRGSGGGGGESLKLAASLPVDTPLHGTNFGGWLHLEDWFFSGSEGRWVATPDAKGQGGCLPPEVPALAEPWPSEGFLVHRLNATLGPAKTVEAFEAHRRSFVDIEDIRQIAKLGMKVVRVPLTWALFPDALVHLDRGGTYTGFDPRTTSVVIPDPYYSGQVAYVTIPRNFVEEMLRIAADEGVQFLLDLHCLPGGSSNGTYNGVYPLRPVFWTAFTRVGENDSMPLETIGLQIAEAMIRWVEGMDEKTRSAVAGVTFMNEPGHMNAFSSSPFARDGQILQWLASAADLFRRSSLPKLGVRLYVNLVETSMRNFDLLVPEWWGKTFTPEERMSWAVIDRHWYAAWSGRLCSGRVTQGGAYFCDQPLDSIRKVWRDGTCARKWAEDFERMFPDSLRACSELSASTFADALLACNNPEVARAFLAEQASAMQEHGIEPFFWTWRMPYGPAFEQGWSLKRIAGLETRPPSPCKPAFSLLVQ